MAKLNAGILSAPRGKVAGVVGSSWKGISYVRQKVTPANPNTAAQQAQRGKMSAAVKFAQSILAGVLIPFVSPFQKKMSGYNWFIKQNIGKITAKSNAVDLRFTSGTLALPTGEATGGSGAMSVTVNFENVANVADGEKMVVGVIWYDVNGGDAYYKTQEVEGTASTATIAIGDVSGMAEPVYHAFVALTKTGLACQDVSNNVRI